MKQHRLTNAWILLCSIILGTIEATAETSHHNVVPYKDGTTHRRKSHNSTVSTGIQMPEDIMLPQDITCISTDENIFEIMNKAKVHCQGHDMVCTFYIYKDHRYHNLGTLELNKDKFDNLLTKYDNWLLTAGTIENKEISEQKHEKANHKLRATDTANIEVKNDDVNSAEINNSFDFAKQEKSTPDTNNNLDIDSPYVTENLDLNKDDTVRLTDIEENEEQNGDYIKLKPKYDKERKYYEVFLPKDKRKGKARTINVHIDNENKHLFFEKGFDKAPNYNDMNVDDDTLENRKNAFNMPSSTNNPEHEIRSVLSNNKQIKKNIENVTPLDSLKNMIQHQGYNYLNEDTPTASNVQDTENREVPYVINANNCFINANQKLIVEDNTNKVKSIVNLSHNVLVPEKYANHAEYYVKSELINDFNRKMSTGDTPKQNFENNVDNNQVSDLNVYVDQTKTVLNKNENIQPEKHSNIYNEADFDETHALTMHHDNSLKSSHVHLNEPVFRIDNHREHEITSTTDHPLPIISSDLSTNDLLSGPPCNVPSSDRGFSQNSQLNPEFGLTSSASNIQQFPCPILPAPPLENIMELNLGSEKSPCNVGFNWLPPYSSTEELRLPPCTARPISSEITTSLPKSNIAESSIKNLLSSSSESILPLMDSSLTGDTVFQSNSNRPTILENALLLPPEQSTPTAESDVMHKPFIDIDRIPMVHRNHYPFLTIPFDSKVPVNIPCPLQEISDLPTSLAESYVSDLECLTYSPGEQIPIFNRQEVTLPSSPKIFQPCMSFPHYVHPYFKSLYPNILTKPSFYPIENYLPYSLDESKYLNYLQKPATQSGWPIIQKSPISSLQNSQFGPRLFGPPICLSNPLLAKNPNYNSLVVPTSPYSLDKDFEDLQSSIHASLALDNLQRNQFFKALPSETVEELNSYSNLEVVDGLLSEKKLLSNAPSSITISPSSIWSTQPVSTLQFGNDQQKLNTKELKPELYTSQNQRPLKRLDSSLIGPNILSTTPTEILFSGNIPSVCKDWSSDSDQGLIPFDSSLIEPELGLDISSPTHSYYNIAKSPSNVLPSSLTPPSLSDPPTTVSNIKINDPQKIKLNLDFNSIPLDSTLQQNVFTHLLEEQINRYIDENFSKLLQQNQQLPAAFSDSAGTLLSTDEFTPPSYLSPLLDIPSTPGDFSKTVEHISGLPTFAFENGPVLSPSQLDIGLPQSSSTSYSDLSKISQYKPPLPSLVSTTPHSYVKSVSPQKIKSQLADPFMSENKTPLLPLSTSYKPNMTPQKLSVTSKNPILNSYLTGPSLFELPSPTEAMSSTSWPLPSVDNVSPLLNNPQAQEIPLSIQVQDILNSNSPSSGLYSTFIPHGTSTPYLYNKPFSPVSNVLPLSQFYNVPVLGKNVTPNTTLKTMPLSYISPQYSNLPSTSVNPTFSTQQSSKSYVNPSVSADLSSTLNSPSLPLNYFQSLSPQRPSPYGMTRKYSLLPNVDTSELLTVPTSGHTLSVSQNNPLESLPISTYTNPMPEAESILSEPNAKLLSTLRTEIKALLEKSTPSLQSYYQDLPLSSSTYTNPILEEESLFSEPNYQLLSTLRPDLKALLEKSIPSSQSPSQCLPVSSTYANPILEANSILGEPNNHLLSTLTPELKTLLEKSILSSQSPSQDLPLSSTYTSPILEAESILNEPNYKLLSALRPELKALLEKSTLSSQSPFQDLPLSSSTYTNPVLEEESLLSEPNYKLLSTLRPELKALLEKSTTSLQSPYQGLPVSSTYANPILESESILNEPNYKLLSNLRPELKALLEKSTTSLQSPYQGLPVSPTYANPILESESIFSDPNYKLLSTLGPELKALLEKSTSSSQLPFQILPSLSYGTYPMPNPATPHYKRLPTTTNIFQGGLPILPIYPKHPKIPLSIYNNQVPQFSMPTFANPQFYTQSEWLQPCDQISPHDKAFSDKINSLLKGMSLKKYTSSSPQFNTPICLTKSPSPSYESSPYVPLHPSDFVSEIPLLDRVPEFLTSVSLPVPICHSDPTFLNNPTAETTTKGQPYIDLSSVLTPDTIESTAPIKPLDAEFQTLLNDLLPFISLPPTPISYQSPVSNTLLNKNTIITEDIRDPKIIRPITNSDWCVPQSPVMVRPNLIQTSTGIRPDFPVSNIPSPSVPFITPSLPETSKPFFETASQSKPYPQLAIPCSHPTNTNPLSKPTYILPISSINTTPTNLWSPDKNSPSYSKEDIPMSLDSLTWNDNAISIDDIRPLLDENTLQLLKDMSFIPTSPAVDNAVPCKDLQFTGYLTQPTVPSSPFIPYNQLLGEDIMEPYIVCSSPLKESDASQKKYRPFTPHTGLPSTIGSTVLEPTSAISTRFYNNIPESSLLGDSILPIEDTNMQPNSMFASYPYEYSFKMPSSPNTNLPFNGNLFQNTPHNLQNSISPTEINSLLDTKFYQNMQNIQFPEIVDALKSLVPDIPLDTITSELKSILNADLINTHAVPHIQIPSPMTPSYMNSQIYSPRDLPHQLQRLPSPQYESLPYLSPAESLPIDKELSAIFGPCPELEHIPYVSEKHTRLYSSPIPITTSDSFETAEPYPVLSSSELTENKISELQTQESKDEFITPIFPNILNVFNEYEPQQFHRPTTFTLQYNLQSPYSNQSPLSLETSTPSLQSPQSILKSPPLHARLYPKIETGNPTDFQPHEFQFKTLPNSVLDLQTLELPPIDLTKKIISGLYSTDISPDSPVLTIPAPLNDAGTVIRTSPYVLSLAYSRPLSTANTAIPLPVSSSPLPSDLIGQSLPASTPPLSLYPPSPDCTRPILPSSTLELDASQSKVLPFNSNPFSLDDTNTLPPEYFNEEKTFTVRGLPISSTGKISTKPEILFDSVSPAYTKPLLHALRPLASTYSNSWPQIYKAPLLPHSINPTSPRYRPISLPTPSNTLSLPSSPFKSAYVNPTTNTDQLAPVSYHPPYRPLSSLVTNPCGTITPQTQLEISTLSPLSYSPNPYTDAAQRLAISPTTSSQGYPTYKPHIISTQHEPSPPVDINNLQTVISDKEIENNIRPDLKSLDLEIPTYGDQEENVYKEDAALQPFLESIKNILKGDTAESLVNKDFSKYGELQLLQRPGFTDDRPINDLPALTTSQPPPSLVSFSIQPSAYIQPQDIPKLPFPGSLRPADTAPASVLSSSLVNPLIPATPEFIAPSFQCPITPLTYPPYSKISPLRNIFRENHFPYKALPVYEKPQSVLQLSFQNSLSPKEIPNLTSMEAPRVPPWSSPSYKPLNIVSVPTQFSRFPAVSPSMSAPSQSFTQPILSSVTSPISSTQPQPTIPVISDSHISPSATYTKIKSDTSAYQDLPLRPSPVLIYQSNTPSVFTKPLQKAVFPETLPNVQIPVPPQYIPLQSSALTLQESEYNPTSFMSKASTFPQRYVHPLTKFNTPTTSPNILSPVMPKPSNPCLPLQAQSPSLAKIGSANNFVVSDSIDINSPHQSSTPIPQQTVSSPTNKIKPLMPSSVLPSSSGIIPISTTLHNIDNSLITPYSDKQPLIYNSLPLSLPMMSNSDPLTLPTSKVSPLHNIPRYIVTVLYNPEALARKPLEQLIPEPKLYDPCSNIQYNVPLSSQFVPEYTQPPEINTQFTNGQYKVRPLPVYTQPLGFTNSYPTKSSPSIQYPVQSLSKLSPVPGQYKVSSSLPSSTPLLATSISRDGLPVHKIAELCLPQTYRSDVPAHVAAAQTYASLTHPFINPDFKSLPVTAMFPISKNPVPSLKTIPLDTIVPPPYSCPLDIDQESSPEYISKTVRTWPLQSSSLVKSLMNPVFSSQSSTQSLPPLMIDTQLMPSHISRLLPSTSPVIKSPLIRPLLSDIQNSIPSLSSYTNVNPKVPKINPSLITFDHNEYASTPQTYPNSLISELPIYTPPIKSLSTTPYSSQKSTLTDQFLSPIPCLPQSPIQQPLLTPVEPQYDTLRSQSVLAPFNLHAVNSPWTSSSLPMSKTQHYSYSQPLLVNPESNTASPGKLTSYASFYSVQISPNAITKSNTIEKAKPVEYSSPLTLSLVSDNESILSKSSQHIPDTKYSPLGVKQQNNLPSYFSPSNQYTDLTLNNLSPYETRKPLKEISKTSSLYQPLNMPLTKAPIAASTNYISKSPIISKPSPEFSSYFLPKNALSTPSLLPIESKLEDSISYISTSPISSKLLPEFSGPKQFQYSPVDSITPLLTDITSSNQNFLQSDQPLVPSNAPRVETNNLQYFEGEKPFAFVPTPIYSKPLESLPYIQGKSSPRELLSPNNLKSPPLPTDMKYSLPNVILKDEPIFIPNPERVKVISPWLTKSQSWLPSPVSPKSLPVYEKPLEVLAGKVNLRPELSKNIPANILSQFTETPIQNHIQSYENPSKLEPIKSFVPQKHTLYKLKDPDAAYTAVDDINKYYKKIGLEIENVRLDAKPVIINAKPVTETPIKPSNVNMKTYTNTESEIPHNIPIDTVSNLYGFQGFSKVPGIIPKSSSYVPISTHADINIPKYPKPATPYTKTITPKSKNKFNNDDFYVNNHIGMNSEVISAPTENVYNTLPFNSYSHTKVPYNTAYPNIRDDFITSPMKSDDSVPKIDATNLRPNEGNIKTPCTPITIDPQDLLSSYSKVIPQTKSLSAYSNPLLNIGVLNFKLPKSIPQTLHPYPLQFPQHPSVVTETPLPTSYPPYDSTGSIKYSGYKIYLSPNVKTPNKQQQIPCLSPIYSPQEITSSNTKMPYNVGSPEICDFTSKTSENINTMPSSDATAFRPNKVTEIPYKPIENAVTNTLNPCIKNNPETKFAHYPMQYLQTPNDITESRQHLPSYIPYEYPKIPQAENKKPYSAVTPDIYDDFSTIPTENVDPVSLLDAEFKPNYSYTETPCSPTKNYPIADSIMQDLFNPYIKVYRKSTSSPYPTQFPQTPCDATRIPLYPVSSTPHDMKYAGYKTYLPASKTPYIPLSPPQTYSPYRFPLSLPLIPNSNQNPISYTPDQYRSPIPNDLIANPSQTKFDLNDRQQSSKSNEYSPIEVKNVCGNDKDINNELKSSLIKYINSKEQVKNELFNNDNELTIPIGDLAIANKEPCNDDTIETNNPSIGLKFWKSNVKIVKAELKLKFKELSVNNFMPVVNNLDEYDVEEIRKIVKSYIDEKYGNHIEVNEPYTVENQYTVLNEFDFNAIDNKFNILWPPNYV